MAISGANAACFVTLLAAICCSFATIRNFMIRCAIDGGSRA
jgi:hypothetical protein